MLEMREREKTCSGSWQPARKAPGRVEAEKKHSPEVGTPQETCWKHVKTAASEADKPRTFSRSRCIARETRRPRDIQQKTVRQNLDAFVFEACAAVLERKRYGTQEVLPRTTTIPVVLKASANHAVAESQRQRKTLPI